MKYKSVEPFVQLPRSLLRSKAWRGLSINGFKLISFLLIERMNHAGKMNGHYKATIDQLIEFGVTSRNRAIEAIREVEASGLIDVQRAGMRTATKFTITWYPGANGEPATNRWKAAEADANPQVLQFEAARARRRKN
jgi:hypothetical protein